MTDGAFVFCKGKAAASDKGKGKALVSDKGKASAQLDSQAVSHRYSPSSCHSFALELLLYALYARQASACIYA